MLNSIFQSMSYPVADKQEEGDVYKVLQIAGQTFRLHYGYYEEYEKENPAAEPMPIYPDFIKQPQYTKDGYPFVTKMQDACNYYQGKTYQSKECAECVHYTHGDDLIGICACPANKQTLLTENVEGGNVK